jgi:tetratricopeptide (TPR) repeat protein
VRLLPIPLRFIIPFQLNSRLCLTATPSARKRCMTYNSHLPVANYSRTTSTYSHRRGSLRLPKLLWALPVLFLNFPALFGQFTDPQNALKAAATAEQSGHYEEAATVYQQLLSGIDSSKADPSIVVHVRTRLATSYYLLHRYRESLEAVAPLTAKGSQYSPLPAQAWLVQGLDYVELGQLPEAIISLRRTLELNPESGTARLALGDALARSGRMQEAVREYENQTERTPSLPDAWYKLGLAYAQLATQVAQDLAQKDPASIIGQQLKAEELFDKGDTLGTAGTLFALLRQAPDQPQAQAELGIVLFHLGYPKAAEDRFRKELSQDPDCPLARLGLAQVAALQGDWTEAISATEHLASSHPRELERLLELPAAGPLNDAWTEGKIPLPTQLAASRGGELWKAWLSDSDSRPILAEDGASSQCSSSSSKATTTPGLWLTEACYQQLRDRLRAPLKAKKALTPGERSKLAEAEFRLGHFQEARRDAERMLESNPGDEWAIYWLSQSSGALAQQSFSKVASLNPDSARLHELLAHYFATRRQFAHAKTEYLAAIQKAPDLPDLHLGLGTLYLQDGELAEAEKELQRTIELSPESTLADYELGHIYVHEQRWDPAVQYLRRAVNDPTVTVKARLDLAKALAETDRTREAVEELLPALPDDKDGQAHYRLAGLYKKLGDNARAEETLNAFKRLRDASIQANRGELEALQNEREKFDPPTSEPPR